MMKYFMVLSQIQALPPGDMADFFKFQEHWQSCLPQILQGETPNLLVTQKMEAKGSKDSSPNKEKNQEKIGEVETSERGAKIPYQQEGNPEKGTLGKKVQGQVEIPSQGLGDSLSLISNKPAIDATQKQPFNEISSPIDSITPLQFTKGNPNAGWIFNEELMPISIEGLLPNKFSLIKKGRSW